jgi:hypothetical protein
MALPSNITPTYNLTIPSNGEQVRFRPFLVKEEKALLIAQQSEDENVMLDTLKDVIKWCIKDDINIDKLAIFDIEYIFMQIRAKSVGEIVELLFKCDTCEDEKAKVKISFDLTKLKVEKDEKHSSTIELFDGVGIKMKYPDVSLMRKAREMNESNIQQIFDIIIECIDFVFTSDEMYYAKDQTKKEMIDFLESLTSAQFVKVQKFFETIPKLRQIIEYECPVCNKHHKKHLEGINSFF